MNTRKLNPHALWRHALMAGLTMAACGFAATLPKAVAQELPEPIPRPTHAPEAVYLSDPDGPLLDGGYGHDVYGGCCHYFQGFDLHGHPIGSPYCISRVCPEPERHFNGYGYKTHHFARPFGSYMRSYVGAQIANGVAGRMVLYHYDFHPAGTAGETTLTARGTYQLWKIARLSLHNGYPLIIEESPDYPGLDDSRRATVAAALVGMNLPDAAQRIVVARPDPEGLDGVEAIKVYGNMLYQTQTTGAIPIRGVGTFDE